MTEPSRQVQNAAMSVTIDERSHRISYFSRPGKGRPILYVHGLGCSKADFLGMTNEPMLDSFHIISYDHPGCGGSTYRPTTRADIDFLVRLLEGFVHGMGLSKFLLVGGSMGGLVGLLFAEKHPLLLTGFVNVEGNLAPEDCMFSSKVVPHCFEHFETAVLPEIVKSLRSRKHMLGFARHLDALQQCSPRAYYDYSFQTFSYSHDGGLLDRFLRLPIPTYFVHGSENRRLSYLPMLRQSDCRVVEVPDADHFLFYDNPGAFAAILAGAP